MTRPKVLKPKVLDVGGDLVLDTERCILCSRCVRFEEEITKTNALGIFDRGDRSTIGIYPGKKIDHNYTTNLVDICPVGAFTSKDFRFKQRVWFLEDKASVCPGCSTGCKVDVHGKVQTRKFFRLKPRKSDVNSHWMCDIGRHHYTHLNKENRLLFAYSGESGGDRQKVSTTAAITGLAARMANENTDDLALLVSPQYTNEEYKAVFDFFIGKVGVKTVYQWREPTENREEFDGLLRRGDHNSNTNGLAQALANAGLDADVKNQFDDVASCKPKVLIALAPELYETFASIDEQLRHLSELPYVSLWTLNNRAMKYPFAQLIPTKGFAEKTGTLLNYANEEGILDDAFPPVVKDAVDLAEAVAILADTYQRMSAN